MSVSTALSQDIHFSQFPQSPLLLNPALTGHFDGSYRLLLNQRTQWRSVTAPYSTFAIAADANNLPFPDGLFNSEDGNTSEWPFHAGLSIYTDKAGDSQMQTTGINLLIADDFKLPFNDKLTIRAGAMVGYTFMKIDYSKLNYDSQWNGTAYDPSLNSGEAFPRASRGYFNLNGGILFDYTITKEQSFSIGLSAFNLSQPSQRFFDEGYAKLDTRFNLHASYEHSIGTNLKIEPLLLAMKQGTYTELNAGGLVHFTLSESACKKNSFYGGGTLRNKDAACIMAGLQLGLWNGCISYDVNISSLQPASNRRGGLEFSLIKTFYDFPKRRDAKWCPDYM
jgi:type IX secretion system PorP/SprF family membrane protein